MPADSARTSRAPSRARFACLVFLFVYPLVTGLLYLSLSLVPEMPVWERTLHIVPVVVVSMVWAIIPLIQKRLFHLL
ncbi:hypothetical protein CG51_03560 [Haematobacter missouriensis]|uniref:Uncharacterized protein n=1 Tax=Haematobacter missouriensis TaxID=366616 RepID=A0A212AWU5_9RHOB|nr:hypothetical protein [Haematobacter missouriensis]KFI33957.1 hypothetical protein CG51_03560 [Haematobacter missouriensis]OWJ71271.1 hypothetical protein CDV53_18910 [Haematobacter missouriensis]OWJ85953.1 hypothetical protein CDV52_01960 [Haematobacter missouriensis]